MKKHAHDWRYDRVDGRSYFECRHKDCHKIASYIQAGEMLNEYETLKTATERLSAASARWQATEHDCMDADFRCALLDYADILERV